MSVILPSREVPASEIRESLERIGLGGGGLLGECSDLEGGVGAALVAWKVGEGDRFSCDGFRASGERRGDVLGDGDMVGSISYS